MNTRIIKIGFQEQAELPIYLNKNGNIECGVFTYKPTKLKQDFKNIFQLILDRTAHMKWEKERLFEYFYGESVSQGLMASPLHAHNEA